MAGNTFGQTVPNLTNLPGMVSVSPLSSYSLQPQKVLDYLKQFALMYPPFYWQCDFIHLPANGSLSSVKTVQNDYFFVGIYMIVMPKVVATVVQPFLLEIKDTGKSKSFMDEPLIGSMVTGTPTEPFYFTSPLLFEPTSVFSVIVTDTSGVADNEVHVIIGGSQIHK